MMNEAQRKKVVAKLSELEQILAMNNPQRPLSSIGDDISDEALFVFLGIVIGQVSNVMVVHPAFTNRLLHELDITVTRVETPPEAEVVEEKAKKPN